jgi:hypothetical protein
MNRKDEVETAYFAGTKYPFCRLIERQTRECL